MYTIHCKDGSLLQIGEEKELSGDAQRIDKLNEQLLKRLGIVTKLNTLDSVVQWIKAHPKHGVLLTLVGQAFDNIAQVVAGVSADGKSAEFKFADYLSALNASERYRSAYLKNLEKVPDSGSRFYSQ